MRTPRSKRWTALAQNLALPVAAFIAIAIVTNASGNVFLSTPQDVWARAVEWWPTGFSADFIPSLRNILVGFALSVIVGVGAGVALGSSRFLRDLLVPTVDFLRSVPNAALVPCLLLIFGFDASTRVLIVFLSAVWPILLGSMDGVLSTDPRLLETARSFRVPRAQRFFKITLPAASPHILSGVKTGLTVSIVVVVISEMFGATEGLGHFIIASQRQFDIAGVWLGTLVIAIVGYGLNSLFSLVQRRMLRWHPSSRIDAS